MELYILRHGLAEENGDPRFPDDSKRPLTEKGEEKLLAAAKAMQKLELEFELILSSPFKRASQTAEVIARKHSRSRLEFSDDLTPEGKPKKLIKQLQGLDGESSVMLVGHEPYLSELISVLISGDSDCGLKLKKGGLCKLAVEEIDLGQCATLEWLLTPAQMEKIAAS